MQVKGETWAERLVRKPAAPPQRPAAAAVTTQRETKGEPKARGKDKKGRKRRKYQHRLYERYLADSGSEADDVDDEAQDVETTEFTVGMDIRVLIQQTLRNMARSVCLEDVVGVGDFGDTELCCFAAALKSNSSILSLQIRHLPVTDASLVPLCRALEQHPSLRALDISDTRATCQVMGPALCHLVCTNSNILFVRIDDKLASAAEANIITKATRYNAMVCPDPTSNPFHLGLIQTISSIEEKQQKFTAELQARPWLAVHENVEEQTEGSLPGTSQQVQTRNDPSSHSRMGQKKPGKGHVSVLGKVSEIGAEVCPQYMQGCCAYGSRCRYFHPEGGNTAIDTRLRYQANAEQSVQTTDDARSTIMSLRQSQEHQRLQSRLRPSQFHLVRKQKVDSTTNKCTEAEQQTINPHEPSRPQKAGRLRSSLFTTVIIGMLLGSLAVHRTRKQSS